MTETTYKINLAEFLEWGYGRDARTNFMVRMNSGNRPGQALMNTLSLFDFESYTRLQGTLADPFYDDSRLPYTLDKLTSK
jgi:hypothetical protein